MSGARHAAPRDPLLVQWILCGCSDVNQRADIVWTGRPSAAANAGFSPKHSRPGGFSLSMKHAARVFTLLVLVVGGCAETEQATVLQVGAQNLKCPRSE